MAKPDKTKKARPKPAEPFFRPFSKLAPPNAKKEKKDEVDRAAKAGASTPAAAKKAAPPKVVAPNYGTARPRPEGPRENTKLVPPKGSSPAKADDAPEPVDPETFAVYMAGVRVLSEDRGHRIPRSASRVERVPDAARGQAGDPDADARARMRSLVADGLRFETVDDGDHLEGRRLDVDPRELRRLRRGAYVIDGKLDLHGLGVDEARLAVEAFVKKRAADGDRAVLVVHGKGTHSPRGHAVLRGEIAAWLSHGRAARHVAAFASVRDDADDGRGAGAVLVLLAR
jgi:DNA-nicking Smr family endonuclease